MRRSCGWFAAGQIPGQTVWYENSGKPAAGGWKKHIIDDQSKNPTHGHAVDMDRDGDLDVLMAIGFGPPMDDTSVVHQVVWYENSGKPAASPWKKHVFADASQAFEAYAADLDGDGDIDVAATRWHDPGGILWIENTGDPRGPWKTHVLKDKWIRANQVIVADLNGDKRPDIIACAERGSLDLRWWRNDGPQE